jgi:hypothetical protein
MLALILSGTVLTLCMACLVGVFAGYVLGYAHRGLVGCRPHLWVVAAWRWWARVTWRLLIGRQDGAEVQAGACGLDYPSFRRP